MSANLLDRIGAALLAELQARQLTGAPIGILAVRLGDGGGWDAPVLGFDLWPCPANPTASWGEPSAESVATECCLSYVDVEASRQPRYNVGGGDQGQYPSASINYGFVHDVCGRYWAEHQPQPERAAGLYLPEAGLANVWPRLAGIPIVSVELTYQLGSAMPADVLLASRFDEESRRLGYRSHNEHLFALAPPQAWSEGKQFGDERIRRTGAAKKHRVRHSPLGADSKK